MIDLWGREDIMVIPLSTLHKSVWSSVRWIGAQDTYTSNLVKCNCALFPGSFPAYGRSSHLALHKQLEGYWRIGFGATVTFRICGVAVIRYCKVAGKYSQVLSNPEGIITGIIPHAGFLAVPMVLYFRGDLKLCHKQITYFLLICALLSLHPLSWTPPERIFQETNDLHPTVAGAVPDAGPVLFLIPMPSFLQRPHLVHCTLLMMKAT